MILVYHKKDNRILKMFLFYIIFFVQFPRYFLTTEVYTKNVTCLSTQEKKQGQGPVYITIKGIKIINNNSERIPHDNYIPENKTLLFNCTNTKTCLPVKFTSLAELTTPNLILKSCVTTNHNVCETIRFINLSKIDKLLFLSKTIRDNTFYFVYCLVNLNGTQTCYKKDDDVYAKRMHKTNPAHVSVFDEFICEEVKTTSNKHKHRDIPLRRARRYDMNEDPCEGEDAGDIDCSKDVCVSWEGNIVDCENTEEIPPNPNSGEETFKRHSRAQAQAQAPVTQPKEPVFEDPEHVGNVPGEPAAPEPTAKGDGKKSENTNRILISLDGAIIFKGHAIKIFSQNDSHEIEKGRCAVPERCKQVVKHRLKYLGDDFHDVDENKNMDPDANHNVGNVVDHKVAETAIVDVPKIQDDEPANQEAEEAEEGEEPADEDAGEDED